MGSNNNNPAFQFRNNVSPHYLEPLFLRLTEGRWYSYADLRKILNDSGLAVQGRDIVQYNAAVWSLVRLVETRSEIEGRSKVNYIQLTSLGRQIIDTYGTNQPLFYDIIHFLFYSSWQRSLNLKWARLWLYQRVCDVLWDEAPAKTDIKALTIRLQSESRLAFPAHLPSFPNRSVGAVFPWLGALKPAFLAPSGNRNQLFSERRSHCTPQLFHLAIDLLYTTNDLRYGTPVAVSDEHIQAICRTCLLDTERFWSMAELTQMSIRGFEIKRGQWATSITLAGPPNWISLPDFSDETDDSGLDGEEEEGEDEQ
jgi:hypothetical protein